MWQTQSSRSSIHHKLNTIQTRTNRFIQVPTMHNNWQFFAPHATSSLHLLEKCSTGHPPISPVSQSVSLWRTTCDPILILLSVYIFSIHSQYTRQRQLITERTGAEELKYKWWFMFGLWPIHFACVLCCMRSCVQWPNGNKKNKSSSSSVTLYHTLTHTKCSNRNAAEWRFSMVDRLFNQKIKKKNGSGWIEYSLWVQSDAA